MQCSAWNAADGGANVRIDRTAPPRKMFQMAIGTVRMSVGQNSLDATAVPIPAECMGHHVITASCDAGVKQAVTLEQVAARGPSEAGVSMPGEVGREQYLRAPDVDGRKA